jgi:hypothetical protein
MKAMTKTARARDRMIRRDESLLIDMPGSRLMKRLWLRWLLMLKLRQRLEVGRGWGQQE